MHDDQHGADVVVSLAAYKVDSVAGSSIVVYLDMPSDEPTRVTPHSITQRTLDGRETQFVALVKIGADVVGAETTVGAVMVAVLAMEAGRPCRKHKGGHQYACGEHAHTLTH
jgi:hypothetical protein